MSEDLCKDCNFLQSHCRCSQTPGEKKSLESAVSGSAKINIPVDTGSSESTEAKKALRKRLLEVENQKFLIRMTERIAQWKKYNGKTPLPIYEDKKGLLWWASREERKKLEKQRRSKRKTKR